MINKKYIFIIIIIIVSLTLFLVYASNQNWFERYQTSKQSPESNKISDKVLSDMKIKATDLMGELKYEEAIVILESLRDSVNETEKQGIDRMLANSYEGSENYDKAEEILLDLLETADDEHSKERFAIDLSRIYVKQGLYSKADKVLSDALEDISDPELKSNIHQRQVYIWKKESDAEGAVLQLEKQLEDYPNDIDILERLGGLYGELHDFEKGTSVYEKLYEIDPSNSEYQNTLISLYTQTRNYEKAQEILEEIIEREPDKENEARLKIALLYIDDNKSDEAMIYIEKYYDTNNPSVEDAEILSYVYEASGQYEKATEILGKAIHDQISDKDLIHIRLARADLFMEAGNFSAAEEELQILKEEFPNNESVLTGIENSLYKLEQLKN